MNKIYKSTLCAGLTLLGLTSCLNDEYEPLNNLADVSWHLSSEASNRNPIIVGLDKYLSLMDLSQGAISHHWEVSKQGTFFLDGNIPFGVNDFTPWIVDDIPYKNSRTTISVLFTEPGLHQVRLRNTFDRMVTYTYRPDPNNRPNHKVTDYATFENGVFVMDTTFVVDVYDNELKPGAKVYRDSLLTEEVIISQSEGSEETSVTIEYGETLYFVDASTDRPNKWTWECDEAGIKPLEGDTVAIKFTKLTDQKPFEVKQTIERISVPENMHVPTATAKTTIVPLKINVIASSKPIEVESASLSNNKVQITLGNAAFDRDLLESVPKGFSLNISNTKDGRPDFTAVAQGVSMVLTESHDNILEVTFDQPIYNTDKLVLTYESSQDSPIFTIDGRKLPGFTMDVKTNLKNCFPDEVFDFGIAGVHETWYGSEGELFLQALADPLFSGEGEANKCMEVKITAKPSRLRSNYFFNAPPGDYTFRCKIYIPEDPSYKSGLTIFITNKKSFQDKTFTNGQPIPYLDFSKPVNRGKWITIEKFIKNSPGGVDLNVCFSNNAFIGTYYIKDLELTNEQDRPL